MPWLERWQIHKSINLQTCTWEFSGQTETFSRVFHQFDRNPRTNGRGGQPHAGQRHAGCGSGSKWNAAIIFGLRSALQIRSQPGTLCRSMRATQAENSHLILGWAARKIHFGWSFWNLGNMAPRDVAAAASPELEWTLGCFPQSFCSCYAGRPCWPQMAFQNCRLWKTQAASGQALADQWFSNHQDVFLDHVSSCPWP